MGLKRNGFWVGFIGMAVASTALATEEAVKPEVDVEASRARDSEKSAEDPTCVFPKADDGAALLNHLKKHLKQAGAPEGLDAFIGFNRDVATIKLVAVDGVEHLVKWRLLPECDGGVDWISVIGEETPQWLKRIQSPAFAKGFPLAPVRVSAFAGESYGGSGGANKGGNKGEDFPLGLIALAGVPVFLVLRRVVRKEKQ